jgi:UDPglucose 6-dehydrogenase
MDLAVIGSGYVGLVTGACFSDLGNNVICIDIDKEKVNRLNKGIIPIYEPGLQEIIQENLEKERIKFTCSYEEGLKNAEVIFIAVGTPSLPNGEADLKYVKMAAREIANHLNKDTVVVNKSTVPVGTGDIVTQIIEENLNDKISFTVVSNPEFLREGSAVFDFMNPDRVVIGDNSGEAAKIVAQLYRPLQCPVIITDIVSAEMIKYSSNAFLATKISFINEVANICERVGADIKSVVNGMGLDKRIESAFLGAGIGFGGSCFPKDTKALVEIAHNFGYDFKVLKSVIEVNDAQRFIVIDKLQKHLGDLKGKRIAVWGLSFKPNTDDIREAPSLDIIKRLNSLGADILAYDPTSIEKAKEIIPYITYSEDYYKIIKGVDALVIVTEWNEFKQINFSRLLNDMKTPLIVDGRNIYSPKKMRAMGFLYEGVGR